MLKGFYFLAVIVLAALVTPKNLPAQSAPPEKPTCFEQAAIRIRPNQSVKLFLRDKSKIKGQFLGIDSVPSLLTMISIKGMDTSHLAYPLSDIAKIEYKLGRGKSIAGSLINGTIGGLLYGLGDRLLFPDRDGDERAVLVGAYVATWLFMGLVLDFYGTIKCK